MKELKNSKGIAFVTVLLLIVIFSILGLTIFKFSMSNAKQFSKSEETMQAVDIAEMGIIHYKNEIIIHANNVLEGDVKKAITLIEENNATPGHPYVEINGKTILQWMQKNGLMPSSAEFLLGTFSPSLQFTAFDSAENYFTINESIQSIAKYPYELTLSFDSYGHTLAKTSQLTGTIALNIKDIIEAALLPGENGEGGASISKPTLPIEIPIVNKTCTSTTKLENDCNYKNGLKIGSDSNNIKAIINGSLENSSNQKVIDNSHLYITGNLKYKNHNTIKNSKLFLLGSGSFSNINKGIFNSSVYFGEGATFGNMNSGSIVNSLFFAMKSTIFENINDGLDKSVLYFGDFVTFGNMNNGGVNGSLLYSEKNIKFENINSGFNSSQLYAGGNVSMGQMNGGISSTFFHIKGNLILGNINSGINNSKIFVEGDLSTGNMNKSISSDSLVCIGGKPSGGIASKVNGINVISKTTHPDTYKKVCKMSGGGTSTTLSDLTPIIAEAVNKSRVNYH